MADIINATGIERRPISKNHTISDLGCLASKDLISRLGWPLESIGAIIVVSQTPDFPLPATACLLQRSLGLGSDTIAFDINLGCSGYVHGVAVISSLIQTAGIERALLVCGDITSRLIDENDRGLRPLFGDAVAVTALETQQDTSRHLVIQLGTDGSGAPYLISRTGGTREPGAPQLLMDGVQVMSFSLKRVAPSVRSVLQSAGLSIEQITAVIFHQANEMMLRNLARKVGASEEQLVLAVKDFGNTSSASIPVALTTWLQGTKVNEQELRFLMSGFGVGWSWGTALWETSNPLYFNIIQAQ